MIDGATLSLGLGQSGEPLLAHLIAVTGDDWALMLAGCLDGHERALTLFATPAGMHTQRWLSLALGDGRPRKGGQVIALLLYELQFSLGRMLIESADPTLLLEWRLAWSPLQELLPSVHVTSRVGILPVLVALIAKDARRDLQAHCTRDATLAQRALPCNRGSRLSNHNVTGSTESLGLALAIVTCGDVPIALLAQRITVSRSSDERAHRACPFIFPTCCTREGPSSLPVLLLFRRASRL